MKDYILKKVITGKAAFGTPFGGAYTESIKVYGVVLPKCIIVDVVTVFERPSWIPFTGGGWVSCIQFQEDLPKEKLLLSGLNGGYFDTNTNVTASASRSLIPFSGLDLNYFLINEGEYLLSSYPYIAGSGRNEPDYLEVYYLIPKNS